MSEYVYLFCNRSLLYPVWHLGLFSNPWAVGGAGVMLLLQLLVVYTPIMQRLFQTRPVPWVSWLDAGAIAVAIIGIVEIDKWIRRRKAFRQTAHE
jgi:magnesium-transporting ATPase (P-type)